MKEHTKPIDTIIVHASWTKPSQNIKGADIKRWHRDRGWSDIGYHWVICGEGDIGIGRPEEYMGAHAYGHNDGSIGICLIGGMGEAYDPKDPKTHHAKYDANFTYRQYFTLLQVVQEARSRHKTITNIIGHRDVNPSKACPCFDVQSLLGGGI